MFECMLRNALRRGEEWKGKASMKVATIICDLSLSGMELDLDCG